VKEAQVIDKYLLCGFRFRSRFQQDLALRHLDFSAPKMGPKKKSDKKSSSPSARAGTSSPKKNKDLPPCAGYLISCDVPTKQYIQYLNELKPVSSCLLRVVSSSEVV
jgi:hypothetical protein